MDEHLTWSELLEDVLSEIDKIVQVQLDLQSLSMGRSRAISY
jgi:hypothetical protein